MNINQIIMTSNTREEVRSALDDVESMHLRYKILLESIDSLNEEIELDIVSGNTDIALLKMSRVVMLEDESNVVERIILMQGLAFA